MSGCYDFGQLGAHYGQADLAMNDVDAATPLDAPLGLDVALPVIDASLAVDIAVPTIDLKTTAVDLARADLANVNPVVDLLMRTDSAVTPVDATLARLRLRNAHLLIDPNWTKSGTVGNQPC